MHNGIKQACIAKPIHNTVCKAESQVIEKEIYNFLNNLYGKQKENLKDFQLKANY